MSAGPEESRDRAPRRVLVYRALGLGDFLAGVPALRQLRRALPEAEIALAAPEVLRPLVELAGVVDRLIPTAELAPVAWQGPPPDLSIDLHGNGPASRRLLPEPLLAFNTPSGPVWKPDEHERARWCRLIEHGLGVEGDPDDVALLRPTAASPARGAVVVHPGAASGSRRWPPERFAEVARALAREHRVVVTGSGAERALVARVVRLAGPGVGLADTPTLDSLAALVADAALVVCGDTGVGHLASAYATPSVLLFGPTPPTTWGPPPGPHTVLWHGPHRGDPHGAEPDPALLAITPDEVLDAARGVIRPDVSGDRSRCAAR